MTIEIGSIQTHEEIRHNVCDLGDAAVVSKRLAAACLRHRTWSGRQAVEV
jgi:hypothetical protein